MSFWNRKKMTEEEMPEINETEFNEEEIKVTDKRRININGKTTEADDAADNKPAKSAEVVALEGELAKERERREAAESKLVGVQAKFEEVKNGLERETQEMRERMRKTLEERAKQGQFNFLTTLLPVLDNLNLAIQAAENETVSEGLMAGIKGTAHGFEQALASVGVEPVAAVGAPFNPELHEAVDMVEAEQDGVITKEYSRGYKFGERLLRPARVQVGRGTTTNAEAAAE
jgi:molecular chaperone GrpE